MLASGRVKLEIFLKNESISEPFGKPENPSTQKCLMQGDDVSFQEGYCITCITLLGCCGTWGMAYTLFFSHVALA